MHRAFTQANVAVVSMDVGDDRDGAARTLQRVFRGHRSRVQVKSMSVHVTGGAGSGPITFTISNDVFGDGGGATDAKDGRGDGKEGKVPPVELVSVAAQTEPQAPVVPRERFLEIQGELKEERARQKVLRKQVADLFARITKAEQRLQVAAPSELEGSLLEGNAQDLTRRLSRVEKRLAVQEGQRKKAAAAAAAAAAEAAAEAAKADAQRARDAQVAAAEEEKSSAESLLASGGSSKGRKRGRRGRSRRRRKRSPKRRMSSGRKSGGVGGGGTKSRRDHRKKGSSPSPSLSPSARKARDPSSERRSPSPERPGAGTTPAQGRQGQDAGSATSHHRKTRSRPGAQITLGGLPSPGRRRRKRCVFERDFTMHLLPPAASQHTFTHHAHKVHQQSTTTCRSGRQTRLSSCSPSSTSRPGSCPFSVRPRTLTGASRPRHRNGYRV